MRMDLGLHYLSAKETNRWSDDTLDEMEITRLTEPFFILRFWTPRADTGSQGHVSYGQDDGTYVSGYWEDGNFVAAKSLNHDVERMGYNPTLTLKLFYKKHMPAVGAVRMWLRETVIGQLDATEVTCASLIYKLLVKGGCPLYTIDASNQLTPVVLRELVFHMIRTQEPEPTHFTGSTNTLLREVSF